MDILKYEDLPHGGFAGLVERKFVIDRRVFKNSKDQHAIQGIGNFVYLADANFTPKGETGLHSHNEIDVISVMVEGNISHIGSLENGESLSAGMVQIQRAGAEGFSHNEQNPDNNENQMIQLWIMPDTPGEGAGYKVYAPKQGERVHVYGGPKDQSETFHSHTHIDVINANTDQTITHAGEVIAYLSKGSGVIDGIEILARTLIHTEKFSFKTNEPSQLILIYT